LLNILQRYLCAGAPHDHVRVCRKAYALTNSRKGMTDIEIDRLSEEGKQAAKLRRHWY